MDKIKKLTKFKQVQPKGTSPKTITKLSKSWTGLQAHPGGHEFNSQNHRRKSHKGENLDSNTRKQIIHILECFIGLSRDTY